MANLSPHVTSINDELLEARVDFFEKNWCSRNFLELSDRLVYLWGEIQIMVVSSCCVSMAIDLLFSEVVF